MSTSLSYMHFGRGSILNYMRSKINLSREEVLGAGRFMWVEGRLQPTSRESLVTPVVHGKRFFKGEFLAWTATGFSAAPMCSVIPNFHKVMKSVELIILWPRSWRRISLINLPYDTMLWRGIRWYSEGACDTSDHDPRCKTNRSKITFTTYNGILPPWDAIMALDGCATRIQRYQ